MPNRQVCARFLVILDGYRIPVVLFSLVHPDQLNPRMAGSRAYSAPRFYVAPRVASNHACTSDQVSGSERIFQSAVRQERYWGGICHRSGRQEDQTTEICAFHEDLCCSTEAADS